VYVICVSDEGAWEREKKMNSPEATAAVISRQIRRKWRDWRMGLFMSKIEFAMSEGMQADAQVKPK
jgi:hypothetical protein